MHGAHPLCNIQLEPVAQYNKSGTSRKGQKSWNQYDSMVFEGLSLHRDGAEASLENP